MSPRDRSPVRTMSKTSTGGYCGVVSTLVRMGFLPGLFVLVVIVVFGLKNAWGSLRYNQSPSSMKPQSDPASRGPPFFSRVLEPFAKGFSVSEQFPRDDLYSSYSPEHQRRPRHLDELQRQISSEEISSDVTLSHRQPSRKDHWNQ